MLTFLREGAKSGVLKFFLIGFMGLAVMGLVFIDMTGSFRDGVSSHSVASVGDTEISTLQMMDALQNAERQSGMFQIPQEMRENLAKRVVDQEIQRRVYAMEAQDIGLIMPDAFAARQIKTQIAPLVESGFTDEEALAQLLRSTGMGEQQLIRAVKQDAAVNTLVQAVAGGSYATEKMIEVAYKYQNQKRGADVLTISKARFEADLANPSDETLREYFTKNELQYMTPEYREISYMVMSEDNVVQDVDTSEETLRSVYDENIDDYILPPRRIVDQVVFQSADIAQAVVAETENAESLKDALASQNADDYILLENESITEDDASVDLVDAAFDTPLGEINGPIQTGLGWVVLAVKSEEEETVQSFEEVREDLQTSYTRERSEEIYYNTANEVDEMLASGMNVSEIADEFKLTVYQTPLLLANGKTKDGKTAEIMQNKFATELLEDAFALRSGEMAPLLETADGRFVAYSVSNIEEPQAKPFETVKTTVENDWRNAELTAQMLELTDEVSEKAENGQSLKALASEYDLPLSSVAPLTAKDATEDNKLDQPIAERLFSLGKVGDVAESIGSDNAKLIELTAIIYPEAKELSEDERGLYEKAIADRIRTDIQMQYEMALREKYDVNISENAIKRAVAPIDEEF